MTSETGTREAVGTDVTRLFIEGLNARDLETLRGYVTEDVEFRTRDGRALRGPDAVELLVTAAAGTNLFLARVGSETVEGSGRVSVPVRVLLGSGDTLKGTAVFELRDGKVAEFEVITDV
jgi:hypothetical protein